MANKITFTYGGKVYVLEYTRKSVEEMERRGFVAEDVLTKPLTVLPELFAGAFIANHRFTKRKLKCTALLLTSSWTSLKRITVM